MNIRNSYRRAYKEGRLNDIPENVREQVKDALKALERKVVKDIKAEVSFSQFIEEADKDDEES